MNAFPQSAAGDTITRRRTLGLLAIAIDSLFWCCVAATHWFDYRISGLLSDLVWSIAFAHTTLAAAWFAVAPRSLFARSLVLLAADLLYAGSGGGRQHAVMLLAVALVHQVAMVLLYFVLARLRLAPRLASGPGGAIPDAHIAHEPARRWQLSLAEVLALATLLAMVMAAGRWFEYQLPILKSGWVVQAVLAALAWGILLIWMPPARSFWIVAATVVALVAPAVGNVLWDPRQARDLATYAAAIGCAGLLWLLVRGRAE